MSCKFSEKEIFDFLDTHKVSSKIKSCLKEFHQQGHDLLNTKMSNIPNCSPFNPYQMYKFSKISSHELGNEMKISAIINKNGIIGMVRPISSKCHMKIKEAFK